MIAIIPMSLVKAEEKKDITNEVEIRYKWYKEVLEGDYYPLKEKQEGYLIDESKIKYGPLSDWNDTNCNLPSNYYFKQYDFKKTYKKVENVRFVKLDNFIYNDNVKIYQDNQPLEYTIKNDSNSVVIDMKKEYLAETLTFYIKDASNYTISLYRLYPLTTIVLSKNIQNEVLLIPDETWITKDTYFVNYYTTEILKETGLTKKIKQSQICRYQEIYIYKYKINREYYDDNYHSFVEGYIKNPNEYQIFYQENPITNIVEITNEKIIKEPKIEYVYIPSKNDMQKNDSSETPKCIPKIKTEIKTIEKEIFKVPTKVYIFIIVLLLIITFLSMKLIKKNVV